MQLANRKPGETNRPFSPTSVESLPVARPKPVVNKTIVRAAYGTTVVRDGRSTGS